MLVLFSLLIAGYFQDKKVSEMIRNLWSIKDITDNFLLLFHLFDIFSEIVSFPGILVLIWTWSNLIPWRIWCLYQSLPGILNNHQVISNFNSFFKGGGQGGVEFTKNDFALLKSGNKNLIVLLTFDLDHVFRWSGRSYKFPREASWRWVWAHWSVKFRPVEGGGAGGGSSPPRNFQTWIKFCYKSGIFLLKWTAFNGS